MKNYHVGNSDETKNKNLVKEMNCILADEYALFTKTLRYHWNLRGRQFLSLHNFFEDQYNGLLKWMDETAERIRMVDAYPIGTLTELDAHSQISDSKKHDLSESEMLDSLTSSHFKIAENLQALVKREDLFQDDPGTEDFLIALLQYHEKQIWMLKSQMG